MANKTHRVTVTIHAEVSDASPLASCRTGDDVIVDGDVRAALSQAYSTADNTDIKAINVTRLPMPEPITKWPFERAKNFWNQQEYWTDKHGAKHEIRSMDLGYVANILHLFKTTPHLFRHDICDEFGEIHRYPDVWGSMVACALRGRLQDAARGEVKVPVSEPTLRYVGDYEDYAARQ